MALGDGRQLVIVTAKTSVLLVSLGMADGARHLLLTAVIQLEDVLAEQGRLPGRSGVTVLASIAHKPGMDCRVFVARHASGGCVSKMLLGMTICTLGLGMHLSTALRRRTSY